MRFTLMPLLLLLCLSDVGVRLATGQVTIIEGGDGKPTVFKMTVSPAAEPQPALKYHFLVPLVEKTPGNGLRQSSW